MEIRKAVPKDARGIARVQVDGWRATYKGIVPNDFLDNMSYEEREQKWAETLRTKDEALFVAEIDREIVGFSIGGEERTGKYPDYSGELYAIYILEEYQRKGIGRELFAPVVDSLIRNELFSMTVAVLKANKSRLFYESLGAKRIGTDTLTITGEKLEEFIYGWDDIREIRGLLNDF